MTFSKNYLWIIWINIDEFEKSVRVKNLTTKYILLNTSSENNDKHLQQVNALTKDDIKAENSGLITILKNDIESDIFKNNIKEEFKDLKGENWNLDFIICNIIIRQLSFNFKTSFQYLYIALLNVL